MSDVWTEKDQRILAGDLSALAGPTVRPAVPVVPGDAPVVFRRVDSRRPRSARTWCYGLAVAGALAMLAVVGLRMLIDIVGVFV